MHGTGRGGGRTVPMTSAPSLHKQPEMALNRGRLVCCGRVPPLPRRKHNNGGLDQNTRHSDGPFTLLSFLTTSHTNRKRDTFSESGWRRRIERGQISVEGTVVRDIGYPLLRAKEQIFYHRYPWKEPIVEVAVATQTASEEEGTTRTRLEILHMDEHLLVVHKPSGLPTMPSQTHWEYSVLNALRRLYNSISQEDTSPPETNVMASDSLRQWLRSLGSAEPQPVHRLGVGTSGVLVLANSLLGRQRLTDAMRWKTHNPAASQHDSDSNDGNTVRKVYRALVYARRCDERLGRFFWNDIMDAENCWSRNGPLIPESFTVDCPIGLVPYPIGGDSIHAACPVDHESLYGHVHAREGSPEGRWPNQSPAAADATKAKKSTTTKQALSHARVLCPKSIPGISDDLALVEVEIPTGRPHQIRIHMAYAGYPLVGDPLYLPGGIPDARIRTFPSRETQAEDPETDDEDDGSGDGSGTTQRVALPRDCGYYLHAHRITLPHPGGGNTVTFVAPPPALLSPELEATPRDA